MEEHWSVQPAGWNLSTPGVARWLAEGKTHAQRVLQWKYTCGGRQGGTMHMGHLANTKAAGGITLVLTSTVLEELRVSRGNSPGENIALIQSVEWNGEQAKTPELILALAS